MAAGDFLDDKTFASAYLTQYRNGMGKVDDPVTCGYHPYGAIKYGAGSAQGARLVRFLQAISSRSPVWFTEAGAYVDQGLSDAAAINRQADNLSNFLNGSTSKYHDSRVKRFYYYEWAGGARFDAGLVGNDDQPRNPSSPTRPVYCVYRHRTAGDCP